MSNEVAVEWCLALAFRLWTRPNLAPAHCGVDNDDELLFRRTSKWGRKDGAASTARAPAAAGFQSKSMEPDYNPPAWPASSAWLRAFAYGAKWLPAGIASWLSAAAAAAPCLDPKPHPDAIKFPMEYQFYQLLHPSA